jgi:hypothetical protein
MKGCAAAGSSLFDLLDGTVSAAGRRKLRQWICRWAVQLLLGTTVGALSCRCFLLASAGANPSTKQCVMSVTLRLVATVRTS